VCPLFGTIFAYTGGYIWHYCVIFWRLYLALLLHIQDGMVGIAAVYSGWYDWHYYLIFKRVWFRMLVRKSTVVTEDTRV